MQVMHSCKIVVDSVKQSLTIATLAQNAGKHSTNLRTKMTKSETRELVKIIGYLDETNLRGMAARSLATLIRSTRGRNTRAELIDFARVNRLHERIEFKV